MAESTPPATTQGAMPRAEQAVHFGYRPALDGLRTVAVYLVVAFHAGVGRFAGGFIGVDLFFVLSGFLVTSVMLSEFGATGRIDLPRFYARRIRRLLPAAVVAIVVIAIAALFFDPPLTRVGFVRAGRSALLYFSNWHFIGDKTDYFAADADTNPYLHFWSLSVEEQFYAAFPLVLVAVLAISRGRRAVAAGIVLAITLLLVLVQLIWWERNPVRAYYGTDARTYQMAAGALLATTFTVPTARRLLAAVRGAASGVIVAVATVALVLASTDLVDVTPSQRGFLAASLALALIAALERSGGPIGWVLSRPTMVQLGRVSYGTYLWHWPIIVYARQIVDFGPVALAAYAAVGATAMAVLSYTVLEMPIRTSPRFVRRSPHVVASGLLLSVLVAIAVVPPILRDDRLPVVSAGGPPVVVLPETPAITVASSSPSIEPDDSGTAPPSSLPMAVASTATTPPSLPSDTVPPDLDLAAAAAVMTGMFDCVDGEPEDCILERGDGLHVFVFGDSNAAMLMPMFRELASDHGFTLSATTAPGCPWQERLVWEVEDRNLADECVATRRDMFDRVLPALTPDVVIGVHIPRDDPARGASPPFIPIDDSLGTGADAIAAATRETLDRIENGGMRMLIIEPVPYTTFDTVHCLSGTTLVVDCAFAATPEPTPTELLYRAEAERRTGVFSVDIDPVVCPGKPLCMPILGDELVYRDAFHIFPPFAVDHRAEIWDLMAATGAFEP